MNLNITKLFLTVAFSLIIKANPIKKYPNEVTEWSMNTPSYFCIDMDGSRFFTNGEYFLCLTHYGGSIPSLSKDDKELTEKHLIMLDDEYYEFDPYLRHQFKNCNVSNTDSKSIDECYEEFADIIGVDVENIKPESDVNKANQQLINSLKDSCEKENGIFFYNDEDYICLVNSDNSEDLASFIINHDITYNGQHYSVEREYSKINNEEFYEYYTRIASLLNVSVDSLVPNNSFKDAFKKYAEFLNNSICVRFYERDYEFICFYAKMIPHEEDFANPYLRHYVSIDEEFYAISGFSSSFECRYKDPGCYDKIAYIMNVDDVNSIIPNKNKRSIIDIEKDCKNESGIFGYGNSYACLLNYENVTAVPQNSVCYADRDENIYCIYDKYTKVESCLKDNEKFDNEACFDEVKYITRKQLYKYTVNGDSIEVIIPPPPPRNPFDPFNVDFGVIE
ncbi:hypothetical protein PIROE2DRAFT_16135 [Piromyces sp. E2]|nr:hypothetical protein PIROE2DRAFT_16135 [Piromyces sp. E2]|eukprot:OUM58543.1 hypothetical protein PIROE2DRAFT_16135 [Piromyces sp. E2]